MKIKLLQLVYDILRKNEIGCLLRKYRSIDTENKKLGFVCFLCCFLFVLFFCSFIYCMFVDAKKSTKHFFYTQNTKK